MAGVAVAALALHSTAALAAEDGEQRSRQAGEDRWVVSFAIPSGVVVQKQEGSAEAFVTPSTSPTPVPIRTPLDDSALVVAPFVGASVEVMTPALPMPTRPRLFASGEVLPTFASKFTLAAEGDPGCVSGPEPNSTCAIDEPPGSRSRAFDESQANGLGTKVTAEIDTLVLGATAGVSFPFEFGERQLRIKPSAGWIRYGVEAKGFLTDVDCPTNRCTDITTQFGTFLGSRSEAIIRTSKSKTFDGIGPGVDLEMDAGRFGPLGVALFTGIRAYHIVGSRKIDMNPTVPLQEYNTNKPGIDTTTGDFQVKVEEWMYRGHVGIRFQWLGNP